MYFCMLAIILVVECTARKIDFHITHNDRFSRNEKYKTQNFLFIYPQKEYATIGDERTIIVYSIF